MHPEAPFNRTKGYMDFDLFCKLIHEAGEITDEVNFSFFGEPMMHPEFLRFMDHLKHYSPHLRIVMNTNLSYATRVIFQKLIEIELAELRISIDAATAEMYDLVRFGKYCLDLDGKPAGANRFSTICQKAEYWFSLSDHRPTRHVFTVHDKNFSELEKYVKKWLPLLGDSDTILCKNVLTYGGKMANRMIRQNPCNVWDLNMLTVDWTGQVTPCNLDTNLDLTIGSVQESTLLKLHHGKRRKQIERLSKRKKIASCRNCIDANNWSRNFFFRKGDHWSEECSNLYSAENSEAGCKSMR